jgi:hypothetical protein
MKPSQERGMPTFSALFIFDSVSIGCSAVGEITALVARVHGENYIGMRLNGIITRLDDLHFTLNAIHEWGTSLADIHNDFGDDCLLSNKSPFDLATTNNSIIQIPVRLSFPL